MGVQTSGSKVKRQRPDKGNIASNSWKVNVFNLTQETRKQPNISNKRLCAGKNGKVNMPTRNNHCHQLFLSDEKGIKGFKIDMDQFESNIKEDIANYVSSKDDLSQKEVNTTEIQLKNTKSKTMTKERNELIIKNLIKKHLPKEIIEEAYESSFNNLDCVQDKEEAHFETLNKRQYVGTSSSAMLSINNPLSFVTEKRRLCDYQDPIFIELKFQQISNEIYDTRNPTTSITEFDHENLSRQQGTEPEYLNTEGFLSQLIN